MAAQTLAPHLVETLRGSAREILETMVSLTPTSVDAREETATTFDDEVIGLLGFTGTRSGTFVVRTSLRFAKQMAANMLMAQPEELEAFEEVSDAFGELVNMLGGGGPVGTARARAQGGARAARRGERRARVAAEQLVE